MMTTKHTNVLNTLFTYLIVLLIFTIGCTAQTITVAPSPIPTNTPLPPTAIPPTPTPTTIPRPPLSADEVKTIAAEFKRIAKANIAAWNNHDLELLRQVYTDDVHVYETGDFPDYSGIDFVLWAMNTYVLGTSPNFEYSWVDIFIGRGAGFSVMDLSGNNEELGFTKDNPEHEYDLFTVREGRIAEWWLYWDSEYWTANKVEFNVKPLQDYATAWSSGEPEAVGSLYDPQAVRTDTLFLETEQGSPAIKEFAANFFAWYPGVSIGLQKSIRLGQQYVGGVYEIHISDRVGQPCVVRAIILQKRTLDDNLISKESVYYQPDTLLACGWAR
jgi:hypothetical protein